MKRYALVSYNIYCNFTNYGSALHTYALQRVVNSLAPGKIEAIILDYCPDVLRDADILNPMKKMWDTDEESRKMVEFSLPAIRINNAKFNEFYKRYYHLSSKKYISDNFNESLKTENLCGYICGSDTIWCIREFGGFDDGYFGNFQVMKDSHTIAYAASFGDVDFTPKELEILKSRMQNYKAISIRERENLELIKRYVHVPVQHVTDPTLLLTGKEYECITAERLVNERYILLYARRYNREMESYADRLAEQSGCKVVEISLRAVNADRHIMYYEAGVEEFLSLVKHAECVITNSFHGVIFGIQMHRPTKVFSREQADTKINELLDRFGLERCRQFEAWPDVVDAINFEKLEENLAEERIASLNFLRQALDAEK